MMMCILNGFQVVNIYYQGYSPHFQHQIPNTTFEKKKKKKSSLHLFQLLTIDIDTQRRPKMWYHEVGGTRKKKKKQPQKLNVVLSCAYLLKVVLLR